MKKILAHATVAIVLLTGSAGVGAAPTKPTPPTRPTPPPAPPPGSGGPYGSFAQCMADGNSMQYCAANSG